MNENQSPVDRLHPEWDGKKRIYKDYCQNCVFITKPIMLTGYCLWQMKCDRCEAIEDLAMVVLLEDLNKS